MISGGTRVFSRQKWLCDVCERSLRGHSNVKFHHVINRKQGGSDHYNNRRARHPVCERLAHEYFAYGNPKELVKGQCDPIRRHKRGHEDEYYLHLSELQKANDLSGQRFEEETYLRV